MTRTRLRLVALMSLAAGCVSSPSPDAGVRLPDTEALEVEREQEAPARVLNDLDRLLAAYTQLRLNTGANRADERRMRVEEALRAAATEHFGQLVHDAVDSPYPRNRAIALAALGFVDVARRDQALDPLVNGLAAEDEAVVNNAILGLAVLQHEDTPVSPLVDILRSEERELETRANAAWALHEIQQVLVDPRRVVRVWLELLDGPLQEESPLLSMTAIRGLGATRDPAHYEAVVPYVSHPVARVRWATAIALGRMADERAVESLLTLLGPAEANDNVKLAARKALQALAGGADRGYDVEAWRKVFERS